MVTSENPAWAGDFRELVAANELPIAGTFPFGERPAFDVRIDARNLSGFFGMKVTSKISKRENQQVKRKFFRDGTKQKSGK